MVQKANQIINDYCSEVTSGGSLIPVISPKIKLPLRIKYLHINKREVKYGETIKSSCTILNEGSGSKKISLYIELKRLGVKIFDEEYKFKINPKAQKIIRLSELKLDKEKFRKGKYILRATIRENRSDIDTKATSFYLQTKRESAKKGFIKKVSLYHNSEEPIRYKCITKGEIKINTGHKDFENIWNTFSEKPNILNKQMEFYIIKICLDEAINELLKIKLKGIKEDLDPDDLTREICEIKDKMYYDVYG